MALSADQVINTHALNADVEGVKYDYKVAAEQIYKNGFVGLNAAGYLTMFTPPTSTTATGTGDRFIGISLQNVNNSSGSAGDKRCRVLVEGHFEYALSSAIIADIGAPIFMSDNATLTKVGSNTCVGYIVNFVSAGIVLVRLQPQGSINYSTPLLCRVTAPLNLVTVGNVINIFHPTENHNGLLVLFAAKFMTTATDNASVVTLKDTGGTTTAITITGTAGADAIGDHGGLGILTLISGALSEALVIVPANLGLDAVVTTATTTVGAANIIVLAVPVA